MLVPACAKLEQHTTQCGIVLMVEHGPASYRILLVEDNRADAYLLRKALEKAGLTFDLIVIEDGAQALAFVRSEGKYAGEEKCPISPCWI